MKYTLILAILFAGFFQNSFAQSDTTYVYYNYDGITTKDSANKYIQFYKEGNLWYGKEYYGNNGTLKSEGYYREPNNLTYIKTFKNYSRKGALTFIAIFDDSSRPLECTYFYPNAKKQVYRKYPQKGVKFEEKCWDSLGIETSNCRIKTEARFKGGLAGWRTFLEKNLNANVPADAGAPEGIYTVTAYFLVATDGSLSHIRALAVPDLCKPCGAEVIRLLQKSPKWEPAIIDGQPDVYEAIQKVSFQVIEEKPRRRRN